MDAISLLKKQHRKAESGLKKLCKGYDKDTLDLVASQLAAHMIIEETLFYPAVRRVNPDLVLENYEEHAVAQFELKRLIATSEDDERFSARAMALLDLIKHHVETEEEKLFPKVMRALDQDELESLGDELEKSFDDLVERGHEEILPRPPAKVTADRQSQRFATEGSMHVMR